ncbi:hypothetical protein D3C81_861550 [compost metagenome]
MPFHGKAAAAAIGVEDRRHHLVEMHVTDADLAVVRILQVIEHAADARRVGVEAMDAAADQRIDIEIGEGLAQCVLLVAQQGDHGAVHVADDVLVVGNHHAGARGIQRCADLGVFVMQRLLKLLALLQLHLHPQHAIGQRAGCEVRGIGHIACVVALGDGIHQRPQLCGCGAQGLHLTTQLCGHHADEAGFDHHVQRMQQHDAEITAMCEGLHRQSACLHPVESQVMHGDGGGCHGDRNPVAVIQQQRDHHEYAEMHFDQAMRLLDGGRDQCHQHQRHGDAAEQRAGCEFDLHGHQGQRRQADRQERQPLPGPQRDAQRCQSQQQAEQQKQPISGAGQLCVIGIVRRCGVRAGGHADSGSTGTAGGKKQRRALLGQQLGQSVDECIAAKTAAQ